MSSSSGARKKLILASSGPSPAPSELRENSPAFSREWAHWKMLEDPRTSSNKSSPAPSITPTQGCFQPNNAPTCLLCRSDNTVAFSISPSIYVQFHSFSQEEGFFFFFSIPGDIDPKDAPLKQSHVSLQSNWCVFLWLGITHSHFSNPSSWRAVAV